MDAEHTVIVSVDSHVGPRLVEDLRPYCPAQYLDDFDAYAQEAAALKLAVAGAAEYLVNHPNFATLGHHESAARLADYDYDGVAAAVIFHASENLEPQPFGPLFPGDAERDKAHTLVGLQIYNRWLADFVSQSPTRHIGLAYLPMWDVDAAITELAWAHEHGLRAVNFPALRATTEPAYNDSRWEPLWAACAERGMPLVTHVGAADDIGYSGPEAYALRMVESGSFFSHRAIWWLIYSGVFERFPTLKLMITETPGNWFPGLAAELDAVWEMFHSKESMNGAFLARCPERPSAYMHRNVYLGASFASPYEVQQAVEHGFDHQLTWGSDYPHVEGTYLNPAGSDMPSVTRLALRNAFCDVEPSAIRRMLGDNAIEFFGLDRSALEQVAEAIEAPTLKEIKTPIDRAAVPAGASMHAFREGQTGWS